VRLGKAGEEVRTGLEVLRRTALRLARRVRDGVGPIAPEGIRLLADALRSTSAEVEQALHAIDGWLRGGGP